ncbi:uncharacterized protein LOC131886902 [Tigriopus californicus]|uniref:uncharacterized protein LOC131886902 n=1 Tax=Tigriopus californicus TaxID=6832 RepID=UPI0027DAA187|nr:uncharacterized protein LOC131886902 [Tigriopus californicus]
MLSHLTKTLVLNCVISYIWACEPLQWWIQKDFYLDCIRNNGLNFEKLHTTPADDLCRKFSMAMECMDHLVACSGSHFKEIKKLVHSLNIRQFSPKCSFDRVKRTKRSAFPGLFSSSSNSYTSSSNQNGYGYNGNSPTPQNSKTRYAFKAVDKTAEKVRNYVDSKYNKNGDSKRAQMASKVINKAVEKAKKMLDKKLNKRTNGVGSSRHSIMPIPIPMGGHTSSFNDDFSSSFLGSGGSSSLLSNFGPSSALRCSSFGSTFDRSSNNRDTTGISSGLGTSSSNYASGSRSGPKTVEDLLVLIIPCRIQDKNMMALIDTTSPISTITMDVSGSLGYGSMAKDEILGKRITDVPLEIGGKSVNFSLNMVRNQPVEIALGTDFLSEVGAIIDLHRNTLSIPSLGIEIDLVRPKALSSNFHKRMEVWSANP